MSEPLRFSWRHWWNAGLILVLAAGFLSWARLNVDGRWVLLAVLAYFELGWIVARSILFEHMGFLDRTVFHDYDKAAARYRKAVGMGSATGAGKAALASLCLAEGDLKEAAALLEEVLLDNPYDRHARAVLVRVLIRQGRLREGESLVLENEDGALKSWLLGETLRTKGELEAAAGSYQKAIQQLPGFVDAHLGLAQVYYAMGKIDASNKEISIALKRSPSNPDVLYWKGRIEEYLGNRNNAKESYEKALLNRTPDDHSYGVSYKELVSSVGRVTKGATTQLAQPVTHSFGENESDSCESG